MTTVSDISAMVKRAKPLRPLIYDPKFIIDSTPAIRTAAEVLDLFEGHDSDDIITIGPELSHCSTNDNNLPKRKNKHKQTIDEKPPKRQKKSQSSQRSSNLTQSSVASTQSPLLSPTLATDGREMKAFQVIYGLHKPYKKHKQFSNDGFVTINCRTLSVHLYSQSGKSIGTDRVLKNLKEAECGKRFVIGGKEVEVSNEISIQEFRSGSLFEEED